MELFLIGFVTGLVTFYFIDRYNKWVDSNLKG